MSSAFIYDYVYTINTVACQPPLYDFVCIPIRLCGILDSVEQSGMEFKDRLRALRIRRGLSQAQLGKAVNTTGTNIYRLEKGDQKPRPELMIALADYFGVTVDYLLGREIPEDALPPGLRELFLLVEDGHATSSDLLKEFVKWAATEYTKTQVGTSGKKLDDVVSALLPDIDEAEAEAVLKEFNIMVTPGEPPDEDEEFKSWKKAIARFLKAYLISAKRENGI